MKILYPLVILMVLCFTCVSEICAQTIISYKYDDSGNRIKRKIVLNTQTEQSTKANLTSKKQVFEEKMGDQQILIYQIQQRDKCWWR